MSYPHTIFVMSGIWSVAVYLTTRKAAEIVCDVRFELSSAFDASAVYKPEKRLEEFHFFSVGRRGTEFFTSFRIRALISSSASTSSSGDPCSLA